MRQGAVYTSEDDSVGNKALPPVSNGHLVVVEQTFTTNAQAAEAATGVRRRELMIDEHGNTSDHCVSSELRKDAASDLTEKIHSDQGLLP